MEGEEPIPISALQHYAFCPRQCALIFVDREWEDNLFTDRGARVHKAVDMPFGALRDGARVEFALPLYSDRLNLVGRADVVEFCDGVPYPVERKLGLRRSVRPDEVQLCAQAICLEEMFGVDVPRGALYCYRTRRRREVVFSEDLRREVENIAQKVRDLIESGVLPAAPNDQRCQLCSLQDICMPYVSLERVPPLQELEAAHLVDEEESHFA